MTQSIETRNSRRSFLKTSSAAALAGALASPLGFPSVLRGAAAGELKRRGIVRRGGMRAERRQENAADQRFRQRPPAAVGESDGVVAGGGKGAVHGREKVEVEPRNGSK